MPAAAVRREVQVYNISNGQASEDIKYEIMTNLLNFFKWSYKLREKDFDSIILENFGLVCCEGCKKSVR